ncbi:SDR family oxidoreductase [Pseudomonas sp. MF6751]|uniref:dTDP-4-dehydrorhamnose reductase family protein n=1 Tax=Pseudomonas TaxID=286 RepID=UPI0018E5EE89|nr:MULTISPECIES: SDR family oxidoreductase [Pseudomonas]MBI6657957.1 SDR family oxidoreductase [Pseudomonas carnis]MBI6664657.1 SDR family oxidoreductase [Pseudomonas carnis]MBI6687215.1 SDR family oxidoreductase [Pseudomonas carnis]MBK3476643.1 SDR family oxidoreductase [Pseudomonas sp. MF6751]
MKVLVLGVTGMLGSAVFKRMDLDARYEVRGTMRSPSGLKYFNEGQQAKLISNLDVLNADELTTLFVNERPDAVINCVGLIKQFSSAKDPLATLPINALLPHRLAKLCDLVGARFVQISTDCVFSGTKGGYVESDISDAEDLYGKSKYIGEVIDSKNAITLRTSIIGRELNSTNSLVDWFLSQSGSVKGYSRAIFSGLPTDELANVIADYVLPRTDIFGLYHVSADPIDKFSLLGLVKREYKKETVIVADETLKIDRSLDSSRFRSAVGYNPSPWNVLIANMHAAS